MRQEGGNAARPGGAGAHERTGADLSRDAPRLREAAHKLSGMVAAFSTSAGSMVAELEEQAAQGQLEQAPLLVAGLEAMAEELLRLVEVLSLESLRSQAGTGTLP